MTNRSGDSLAGQVYYITASQWSTSFELPSTLFEEGQEILAFHAFIELFSDHQEALLSWLESTREGITFFQIKPSNGRRNLQLQLGIYYPA